MNETSLFNRHIPNGSRRPKGCKKDSIVHAKGGGQEIIQRADRVDWRNVYCWSYADESHEHKPA